MEKTKEFPVMVNAYQAWRLPLAAKQFVEEFTGGIFPILHKFQLLNDENIQKYIFSLSRKDIYEDVLRDNPSVIEGMKQDALFEPDRDVWGIFRDCRSPVKSPLEDGFIFASMPMHDYSNRNFICKSLSVKDKVISVNEEYLLSGCIVHPTPQQEQLWALLSDFCEKFNEAGFYKKWFANHLFVHSNKGIKPSIEMLLGRTDISRKR